MELMFFLGDLEIKHALVKTFTAERMCKSMCKNGAKYIPLIHMP